MILATPGALLAIAGVSVGVMKDELDQLHQRLESPGLADLIANLTAELEAFDDRHRVREGEEARARVRQQVTAAGFRVLECRSLEREATGALGHPQYEVVVEAGTDPWQHALCQLEKQTLHVLSVEIDGPALPAAEVRLRIAEFTWNG